MGYGDDRGRHFGRQVKQRNNGIGHFSDSLCPVCGSAEIDEDGPYCRACSKRFTRKDPAFFDTTVLISIIAVTMAFIILPKPHRGLNGLDLSGLDGPARILILSSMIPVIFSMVLRIKQIGSIHQWKNLIRTIIPIIMMGPILPFIVGSSNVEGIIITFALFVIVIGLAIFSKNEIMETSPILMIVSFMCVLLFGLGFADSIGVIAIPEGPWILDGHYLALFGMIGFLLATFMMMRSSDLETIEGVPVLLWMIGITMVSLVLLIGPVIGDLLFSFIMSSSMLIICTSTMTMAARKDVERVIFRTEHEIEDFLRRGEDYILQGRSFYGLQQIDLALRKNPFDAFGKQKGIDNPLFKVEGQVHTNVYNYSAKPNELALNEKGLTFCTQGRLSDAIRSYQEAARRDPDYLEPYWNLYTLLSTMPGKTIEGMRYADYLITLKSLYMRKWMKRSIQRDHADWLLRCLEEYRMALYKRAELLAKLSSKGDIWAYYRMA